jgi:hypothetical protein
VGVGVSDVSAARQTDHEREAVAVVTATRPLECSEPLA